MNSPSVKYLSIFQRCMYYRCTCKWEYTVVPSFDIVLHSYYMYKCIPPCNCLFNVVPYETMHNRTCTFMTLVQIKLKLKVIN